MLSNEAVQSAIDLAEELDRRNIGLQALPGSLVADLVAQSALTFTEQPKFGLSDEELSRYYEPKAQDIVQAAAEPARTLEGEILCYPHADTLDQAVMRVADAAKAHLQFARNVVRPAVKEYHDRVLASLQNLPQAVTFNPVVVRVDLPTPLLSPTLMSAVSEYRSATYLPIASTLKAPEQTGAEILAHMATGNAAVDTDTTNWFTRLGEPFFQEVWSAVFGQGLASGNFAVMIEDRVKGADVAMAVFLLARRLIDNPLPGVELNLAQWRVRVGDLLQQAGLRLAHLIEERENNIKTKLLVLSYSRDVVRVLGPVYDDFLDVGGSDAILFGSILSDAPRQFAPAILEKAGEFLATWERQNSLLTAAAVNKRYVLAREILVFKAEELVAANLAEFYPQVGEQGALVLTVNHPVVDKAMRTIKEMVEDLQVEDLVNLWDLSTAIVAKGIFYYTDAFKILDGINRAVKLNPDISYQEAALLSRIEYVADYLVDQLAVVDL